MKGYIELRSDFVGVLNHLKEVSIYYFRIFNLNTLCVHYHPLLVRCQLALLYVLSLLG